MSEWVKVADEGAIDAEDVLRFDRNQAVYAVCRDEDGAYFTLDGLCTHERVLLTKGFVVDGTIECPVHQGRFELATGRIAGGPVCVDLKTYPTKVENGAIWAMLP